MYLIEDCAQAHFAEFQSQRVGTFGIAGTFSFYPGKNLGAYGDAGAIVTNSDELAERCQTFARHGANMNDKHDHVMEGINSRMDGLQAAILSVKLPYVESWNQQRHERASRYNQLLGNSPDIVCPQIRADASHIFHVYAIRIKNRDYVREKLNEHGIQTGIHYPKPLPFLQAYRYLGHVPADFPVAYRHHQEMLSLPIYPELTNTDQDYVVENLIELIS